MGGRAGMLWAVVIVSIAASVCALLAYTTLQTSLRSFAHLSGWCVFAALAEHAVFAAAELGAFGQVQWESGIDLCPNALYLRRTRKTPRELFPSFTRLVTRFS